MFSRQISVPVPNPTEYPSGRLQRLESPKTTVTTIRTSVHQPLPRLIG